MELVISMKRVIGKEELVRKEKEAKVIKDNLRDVQLDNFKHLDLKWVKCK